MANFTKKFKSLLSFNQSEKRVLTNSSLVAIPIANWNLPIYKYCPRSNKWSELFQYAGKQQCFAACLVNNNELIIAGGFIDKNLSNTVICLNLSTKSVQTLNNMNTCRASFSLALLGNSVYAIGGGTGSGTLNAVERLDQNSDVWHKWAYVASMNKTRCRLAVAVLDELLYAVGGWSEAGEMLSSVECYNPKSNEWLMRAPMHWKRASHRVAVLNNYIYALGGGDKWGSYPTVERYDPLTDKWTAMCGLKYGHDEFACVAMNGRLIVAGGCQPRHVGRVEEYNPELNKWKEKPALPENGNYVGVVVENEFCSTTP